MGGWMNGSVSRRGGLYVLLMGGATVQVIDYGLQATLVFLLGR